MIETFQVPIEKVTPIKPSEAIRLGCIIAPIQLFNSVYIDEQTLSACAIGAMALGMGGDWNKAHGLVNELHGSDRFDGVCPEQDCVTERADPVHLNDTHRWSRERIADWLEEHGL